MSSVAASPFRRFVPFALLLALSACQEAPKKNTFRYVTPTTAQAEEFAKSFELALTNRNAQRMTRLIGWDHLIEKATSDVEAPAQFRRDFIKGAKQSIATNSFAKQFIGIVEKGGSIQRLHFRTVNGETRLVLRILMPDEGGVNYHEMTLHRDASGFVQASDIYVYTAAEPLSKTFERNFRLSGSRSQLRSRVLARLVTGEKPSVTTTDYANLTKMAEAARKGEDDRTLELYGSSPRNCGTTRWP